MSETRHVETPLYAPAERCRQVAVRVGLAAFSVLDLTDRGPDNGHTWPRISSVTVIDGIRSRLQAELESHLGVWPTPTIGQSRKRGATLRSGCRAEMGGEGSRPPRAEAEAIGGHRVGAGAAREPDQSADCSNRSRPGANSRRRLRAERTRAQSRSRTRRTPTGNARRLISSERTRELEAKRSALSDQRAHADRLRTQEELQRVQEALARSEEAFQRTQDAHRAVSTNSSRRRTRCSASPIDLAQRAAGIPADQQHSAADDRGTPAHARRSQRMRDEFQTAQMQLAIARTQARGTPRRRGPRPCGRGVRIRTRACDGC